MKLGPHISCDRVGDQWLVVSRRDNTAHHLTGPAATVMDCVTTGETIPSGHDDTVSALLDAGILTSSSGWSRRQVLATAATAAAVGITTAALPAAAFASSSGPNPVNNSGSDPGPAPNPDLGLTWSADGITGFDSTKQWTSVAYGGGVWIAVGVSANGVVMRSADNGLTWSAITASENSNWNSVAYGGGVWVAVAGSSVGPNRVMRSTDNGLTWTASAPDVVGTGNWRSVAYGQDGNGDGLWVAVQDMSGSQIMASPDGVTWTPGTAPPRTRGDLSLSATASGWPLPSIATRSCAVSMGGQRGRRWRRLRRTNGFLLHTAMASGWPSRTPAQTGLCEAPMMGKRGRRWLPPKRTRGCQWPTATASGLR